jgi:hypothetical protein
MGTAMTKGRKANIQTRGNARSTRGFVVEAQPQRKSRRCACDC